MELKKREYLAPEAEVVDIVTQPVMDLIVSGGIEQTGEEIVTW